MSSGQPKFKADTADFILEEFAQRLDQFEMHSLRQPPDVVMRLDRLRRSLDRHRLDDVRIHSPLNQKIDGPHLLCFFFKDLDEFPANDLALAFGLGNAGKEIQEAVGGIHSANVQVEIVAKQRKHLFKFVLSKQAVVDEHAGQPIADRPGYECGRHCGVHTTADGAYRSALPYLILNPRNGTLDKRAHRPGPTATTNIKNKSPQQRRAILRVRDLGVKLNSENLSGVVFHRRHRRIAARRNLEVRRGFQYPVAMTHPHALQPVEKAGRTENLYVAGTVLTLGTGNNLASQVLRHQLHSVTDA